SHPVMLKATAPNTTANTSHGNRLPIVLPPFYCVIHGTMCRLCPPDCLVGSRSSVGARTESVPRRGSGLERAVARGALPRAPPCQDGFGRSGEVSFLDAPEPGAVILRACGAATRRDVPEKGTRASAEGLVRPAATPGVSQRGSGCAYRLGAPGGMR